MQLIINLLTGDKETVNVKEKDNIGKLIQQLVDKHNLNTVADMMMLQRNEADRDYKHVLIHDGFQLCNDKCFSAYPQIKDGETLHAVLRLSEDYKTQEELRHLSLPELEFELKRIREKNKILEEGNNEKYAMIKALEEESKLLKEENEKLRKAHSLKIDKETFKTL